MKTPLDTVKGKIVGYNPMTEELTIVAKYNDTYMLQKREYKECLVQLIDSRPLSEKQRRACYAMIKEIANHSGMGTELTKQHLKLKFLADDLQETADKIFSLSSAPMSLVCAFQDFLVRFIIDFDVPTKYPLLDMVDDIDSYMYACLTHKKCCVCGKPAQLHHRDAIGMGRDRTKIVHEGLEGIPLCAEHHTEMHTIGDETFMEKYHFNGGIPIDKTICRVYGLRMNKDELD